MRKTISLEERTAVRAYYAWLNGSPCDAEANWLMAEDIERPAYEKRRASAQKGLATRRLTQSYR